jgi:hypothetical protein
MRPDRLTSKPFPVGCVDPMYMIVKLAIGAKYFKGVGLLDAESAVVVEFQTDRISVYQASVKEQSIGRLRRHRSASQPSRSPVHRA